MDRWFLVAQTFIPRFGHTAVTSTDKTTIFILGGHSKHTSEPVEQFDPVKNEVTPLDVHIPSVFGHFTAKISVCDQLE